MTFKVPRFFLISGLVLGAGGIFLPDDLGLTSYMTWIGLVAVFGALLCYVLELRDKQ